MSDPAPASGPGPAGPRKAPSVLLATAAVTFVGAAASVYQFLSSGPQGLWWFVAVVGLYVLGAGGYFLRRRDEMPVWVSVVGLVVGAGFLVVALDQLFLRPDEFPPRPDGGRIHITSPTPNARVGRCERVTGTAALPIGKTVVVARTNTSTTEDYYADTIRGFDPDDLQTPGTWEEDVYFGMTAGQTYRVVAFEADISAVAEAKRAASASPWHFTDPPAGFVARATLEVLRIDAPGPCHP